MKPDIKHRIEQLRRGEVPEGYKKTKAGIMPKEWEEKKIKEVAPLQRGFDLPSYDIKNGKYPICYSNGISAYHSEFKVLGPGVWTGRSGTMGMVFYTEDNFWPHNTCLWVTNFFKNNPKFIFYLFNFLDFNKYNAGSSVPTLNRNDIHVLEVGLPPLPEQQKIADILSTQDKVIELKEQLLAQKQQQKKYLMQQLLTGKKRLPGFNGEWRKEQVRNLCTVVKGEQLNKDILDEIGLYYVLNGGMTPSGYTNKWNIMENTISISEGGNSCGYVNFNREKFWSGGHCYTLQFVKTSEIMNLFLYFYLKFCENKLQCLRVGSGLPNIQKSSLENFNVTYPTLEEQTAIADVLSSADREIDLLRQSIEAEKQKKKALMQLLLTGIVRVNV